MRVFPQTIYYTRRLGTYVLSTTFHFHIHPCRHKTKYTVVLTYNQHTQIGITN